MTTALRRGVAPLVASAPSDDETSSVTAYDRNAKPVLLDAKRTPGRPVHLVEIDSAAALSEGVDLSTPVRRCAPGEVDQRQAFRPALAVGRITRRTCTACTCRFRAAQDQANMVRCRSPGSWPVPTSAMVWTHSPIVIVLITVIGAGP